MATMSDLEPLLAPLDPVATPPDPAILGSTRLADDLFRRWLPWCEQGDALLVATCVPVTPELRAEVAQRTGAVRLSFGSVSSEELALTAERLLSAELARLSAEGFAERMPELSAKSGVSRWQSLLPAAILALCAIGLILDWQLTLVIAATVANVTFLLNVGFKVTAASLRPLHSARSRAIVSAERRRLKEAGRTVVSAKHLLDSSSSTVPTLPDEELPVYTILVPVYQEANVVAHILRNFERLDYPAEKLDIMILLEADDSETIAAARAADPPANVRLMIVPEGSPRTKPRACNYGLLFARGEYVVIYDAEDRPEPDQLRKVLLTFRTHAHDERHSHTGRTLACVQASLNYYNGDYNLLTRMFAIEYAQWFDSMLAGMDTIQAPIPLGGTSNHFLRSALIEAGGWDPYNVTEDADLGIRLARSGYRVSVVKSTTWEEATPQIGPWIRQRTRWIKGYLLTAAVNLRRPLSWARESSLSAHLTMFGLILGTPLSFLLYPLALGFTVFSWLIGPVLPIRFPEWLLIVGWVNMFGMNLLMVLSSGFAAWKRYNWRVAAFAVFLPIYWLLHAFAAWRAAIQLAHDPFGWEKTPHGLTEDYDDATIDVGGLSHSARG